MRRLIARVSAACHAEAFEALCRSGIETASLAFAPEPAAGLEEVLRRTLHATSVVVLERWGDSMVYAGGPGPGRPVLPADATLVRWLEQHRTALASRSLEVDPTLQNLPSAERRALERLGAHLVMPVLDPRGALLAAAILGPKANGRPYTRADLRLLEVLAAQAAVALEAGRLRTAASQSRSSMEAWLERLHEPVLVLDPARFVRFANKAARDRLEARCGAAWPPPEFGGGLHGPPRQTIRGRIYQYVSSPFVDETGERCTIVMLEDVTEREQYRAAYHRWKDRSRRLAHAALVGEAASSIAHEIANPLTAVVGYTGLLEEMPLPAEARELLAQILGGARRAAAMMERLLAFAQPKRSWRRMADLNELVRATLELRGYSLRTNNIQVVLDLEPQLPRTLLDAHQVQLALLALITASEVAMSDAHGCGLLTIRTRVQGSSLLLLVRDDRPVPYAGSLADPPSEKGASERADAQSAFALDVSSEVAHEHNGRLEVRGEAGRGTEVSLLLPLVQQEPEAPSPEESAPTGGRPRRALVVEDEPSVYDLLCAVLASDGYEVEGAADLQAAIEAAASGVFDLLILDASAAGASLRALWGELERRAPELARRTVVATGENVSSAVREVLARAGARCIAKPFDVQALLRLARELAES